MMLIEVESAKFLACFSTVDTLNYLIALKYMKKTKICHLLQFLVERKGEKRILTSKSAGIYIFSCTLELL